jgi:hypothetical protein
MQRRKHPCQRWNGFRWQETKADTMSALQWLQAPVKGKDGGISRHVNTPPVHATTSTRGFELRGSLTHSGSAPPLSRSQGTHRQAFREIASLWLWSVWLAYQTSVDSHLCLQLNKAVPQVLHLSPHFLGADLLHPEHMMPEESEPLLCDLQLGFGVLPDCRRVLQLGLISLDLDFEVFHSSFALLHVTCALIYVSGMDRVYSMCCTPHVHVWM